MRARRSAIARCLVVPLSMASLLAALAASPASAAGRAPSGVPGATSYVEGIDVSHYQETIDWSKVAASGKRFAIAKASEGQTFVDPMFATNRAGAKAAGLVFGAYHYADPDTSPNDAVLEADHFASVAGYQAGEVRPTLDLENNGGLSVSQLQTWVNSFLKELTARTGKKAMIYTSPNFWSTSMGDTAYFATHGYSVLWIANWGVPDPSVPANNWGGNGWTFWQWTDCESVPGITTGCVDGDRYHQGVMAGITA
jgi:lysozyme